MENHAPVIVDDEPVPGGELIVNVNEIIGRLTRGAAHGEKLNGNLGFQVHLCRKGKS